MKKNWTKLLLQWGVLLTIIAFFFKPLLGFEPADVEAYCPFGGLQTLLTYLQAGTLACSMSMVQIMIGVALAVGVILFSKLFCGYLCPLGTLNELLSKLRKPLGIRVEIKNGSVADKALRILKYVLLAWIFFMTITSSELFCKRFDPYYALATGFKGEIILWMALVSIGVFLVCGVFIKMFWCKYICPLGALSNIFKFTFTFACVVLGFSLLRWAGVEIGLPYLIIISAAIAYLWEILYMESKIFPLVKIHRDEEACNDCGLCHKKCPYSIEVDKVTTVKAIDCTLCGDCIEACGKRKALTIGKTKGFRFLPAIMTIILFVAALFVGSQWEIPTIDERFEGFEEKKDLIEMVEMEGIKSVKCFGSSKAFSARMQNVPGIYGVTTFTQRFAVQVYYNPSEITLEKVQELIFSPVRRRLNDLPQGLSEVKIITLGVEGLFDAGDVNVLGNILKENPQVFGIQSEYNCPVVIKLFVDPAFSPSKKELAKVVEINEFEMTVHGGGKKKVECDYTLVTMSKDVEMLGRKAFLDLVFPAQDGSSKKNLEKYGEGAEVALYEIAFADLEKPLYQRGVRFLGSHATGFDGVMRWATALRGETPVVQIYYIPSVLDDAKLWDILSKPMWTIYWPDGRVEEVEPKMKFEQAGQTL